MLKITENKVHLTRGNTAGLKNLHTGDTGDVIIWIGL